MFVLKAVWTAGDKACTSKLSAVNTLFPLVSWAVLSESVFLFSVQGQNHGWIAAWPCVHQLSIDASRVGQ